MGCIYSKANVQKLQEGYEQQTEQVIQDQAKHDDEILSQIITKQEIKKQLDKQDRQQDKLNQQSSTPKIDSSKTNRQLEGQSTGNRRYPNMLLEPMASQQINEKEGQELYDNNQQQQYIQSQAQQQFLKGIQIGSLNSSRDNTQSFNNNNSSTSTVNGDNKNGQIPVLKNHFFDDESVDGSQVLSIQDSMSDGGDQEPQSHISQMHEFAELKSAQSESFEFPQYDYRRIQKLRIDRIGNVTLVNQYIIVQYIGKGSCGKVYLVYNTLDQQLYAMKVVLKQSITLTCRKVQKNKLDSSLSDVKKEINVMKQMKHKNIVQLREVIDDPEGSKILLVLEYMPGGCVLSRKQQMRQEKLSEASSRKYFREMIKGLDYLHYYKIVHGDIKPENILINANGTVKLSDFGCSKVFNTDNEFLEKCDGTPAYIAPEMMRQGSKYRGQPTDIYALGACLYVFIYGQIPFTAPSVQKLFQTVIKQQVQFPASTQTSPELKDLIMKMLEKDPVKRIQLDDIMTHTWATNNGLLSTILPYKVQLKQKGRPGQHRLANSMNSSIGNSQTKLHQLQKNLTLDASQHNSMSLYTSPNHNTLQSQTPLQTQSQTQSNLQTHLHSHSQSHLPSPQHSHTSHPSNLGNPTHNGINNNKQNGLNQYATQYFNASAHPKSNSNVSNQSLNLRQDSIGRDMNDVYVGGLQDDNTTTPPSNTMANAYMHTQNGSGGHVNGGMQGKGLSANHRDNSIDQINSLISSVNSFHSFNEEDTQRELFYQSLAKLSSSKETYQKGQYLWRQKEQGQHMCYILQGAVEITVKFNQKVDAQQSQGNRELEQQFKQPLEDHKRSYDSDFDSHKLDEYELMFRQLLIEASRKTKQQLTKNQRDDYEYAIQQRKVGDLVGEMALCSSLGVRCASVKAITKTTVCIISREKLLEFIVAKPEYSQCLKEIFLLRESQLLLSEAMYKLSHISENLTQKYGINLSKLPQQLIAQQQRLARINNNNNNGKKDVQ